MALHGADDEWLRPTDDDRAALRRLCAGTQEASDPNAEVWALDGARAGIESVVTSLLNRSEGSLSYFIIHRSRTDNCAVGASGQRSPYPAASSSRAKMTVAESS